MKLGSILQMPDGQLLTHLWANHAKARPGSDAIIHWVAESGEPVRLKWGDLFARALGFARAISDQGVKKGEVCAIIIRHLEDFYPLYMGIDIMGAIPAILAYPNPRLHPDKFREGIHGMSRYSGLQWIFTERDLEDTLAPLVINRDTTVKGMVFPLEWKIDGSVEWENGKEYFQDDDTDPDEPCLLQHSSGTTGLQKAVVLSHRAVLDHLRLYGESLEIVHGDKIVSWLPLYHDMGLIACLHLPLAWGIPLVQMDAFDWVKYPQMLLEAVSREGGSLTWLPNFAYNFMADRIDQDDLEGISLDSLRMVINCSEPVRDESHEKFFKKFKEYGLLESSLGACYAMAETTFAVTQTSPGGRARTLNASRKALSEGVYLAHSPDLEGGAKLCVSSGPVIEGCMVKIVDEEGQPLKEGEVGEIAISSVSMFDCYRNQPEKTAEVLKDGWYFSGDYGFEKDGEYYVIGRKKDIIIIAGHNIAPEDIEDAVNEVSGVIPGRSVAFGLEDHDQGTEIMCVVVETKEKSQGGLEELKRRIRDAGMRIDVTISRVYMVPPRWLIKSSSGKLSRKVNKERVLSEYEEGNNR